MSGIDLSKIRWDDPAPDRSIDASRIRWDETPEPRGWSEVGRQLGLTGRAAVGGMGGLLGMFGDPLNVAVNAVAGTSLPPVSSSVQRVIDKFFPAPRDGVERVVQDVAGAMAGAGGMIGAANQAARGAQAMGRPMMATVAKWMGDAPAAQLASAATAGGAGGAERERGGGVGGQLAASLLGGLAPAGGGAAIAMAKGAAKPVAPIVSRGAATQAAAQRFRKMASEPDSLGVVLSHTVPAGGGVPGEIVAGSAPTTGQMLGDNAMLAAERARCVNRPDFARKFEDRAAEQTAARLSAMDGISPVDKPLNEAAQDAGAVIAEVAHAGRTAAKEKTRAAYDAPDVQSIEVPMPADAVGEVMQKYYGNLSDRLAPGPLRTLVNAIVDQEGKVPFRDFQTIRHLAAKMAKGMYQSDPTASAAAREIATALDAQPELLAGQAAAKLSQTGAGEHGPVFGGLTGDPANAVAHLMRRQTGEVPGALSHAEIDRPIDLLWGRAPSAETEGYGLAKIAAKHPEVLPDIQAFLHSMHVNVRGSGANRIRLADEDLRRGVVRNDWEGEPKTWLMTAFEKQNPATGGASSGSGKRTDTAGLAHGSDTALPATDSNVKDLPPYVNLVMPEQAAALKQARAARIEQADNWETGAAVKLWKRGADGLLQITGGEIPRAFFNDSKTSLQDIRQFMKSAGNREEAVDALKNYAITGLHDRAYSPTTGRLMPDKFRKWVAAHDQALDMLLGREHTARLQLIADDLLRANRSNTALKAPGSDTAQNLAQGLGQTLLSKIPGGGLVLSTGRVIVNAVRSLSEAQIDEMVDRALLDPAFAQLLLTKVTPANKGILSARFAQAMQGALAGGAAVRDADRAK